jgi:hypothetical protein
MQIKIGYSARHNQKDDYTRRYEGEEKGKKDDSSPANQILCPHGTGFCLICHRQSPHDKYDIKNRRDDQASLGQNPGIVQSRIIQGILAKFKELKEETRTRSNRFHAPVFAGFRGFLTEA